MVVSNLETEANKRLKITDDVAVLPLARKTGGHRLGVNGLALDEDSAILYEHLLALLALLATFVGLILTGRKDILAVAMVPSVLGTWTRT